MNSTSSRSEDGGGSIDTEKDGLTRVLTCTATVNSGATNHMKLAIADVSDGVVDNGCTGAGGALIEGAGCSLRTDSSGPAGLMFGFLASPKVQGSNPYGEVS